VERFEKLKAAEEEKKKALAHTPGAELPSPMAAANPALNKTTVLNRTAQIVAPTEPPLPLRLRADNNHGTVTLNHTLSATIEANAKSTANSNAG